MDRRHGSKIIWLVSLLCFSLAGGSLEATVSVTTSADSGAGSFRQAISDVNTVAGTSPISLDPGVDPTLTSNIIVSILSAEIIATDSPVLHTITGGGNVVLNAGLVGVVLSVSEDIQFATANMVITEGTLQFNGPDNLTGVASVQMSGAAPVFQFSGTTTGTLASNLNLLGVTNILKIDPTLTITITGGIAGSILEKQGTGTLILPNANVYGGTVLSAGTIEVQNNTSLGIGTIVMGSATTLLVAPDLSIANVFSLGGTSATISVASGVVTIGGVVEGSGSLLKDGAGTLSLIAANTYTGTTTVNAGTLMLTGSHSTVSTSTAVSISSGAVFDISGMTTSLTIQTLSGAGSIVLGANKLTVLQVSSGTFSGVIGVGATSGGLTLSSSSTSVLTLSGVNLYTGATAINGGTLALSGSGSIAPSSSVSITGILDIAAVTVGSTVNNVSGAGNIALGTKTLNIVQTTEGTLSGVISGVFGNLVLDGASTNILTLSGINTYSGTTSINGGVLALSGSGSIEDSISVSILGGLDIHEVSTGATIHNLSGTGNIFLGSEILTVIQTSPGTFSGVISGPLGDLILGSGSTSTLTLSGVNLYTGRTVVEAGTLGLSGSGSIANSSSVTLTGDLDISGVTTGTLIHTLSGTGNIDLGSNELKVIQRLSGVFTGVISGGAGSLILDVNAAGILTLSGVNTYTGLTRIDGGVLALLGSGSIANSSSVEVNGLLDVNTTTLGTTIQNLSGIGYITLGTKTLTVDQSVSGVFSGMILGSSGSLTKTGASTLIITGSNNYSGVTTIDDGTLQGNALSLPSAIVNQSILIFNQVSNGTYSHVISGSGVMTKVGSGNLTLSGVNTYTGITTITEGALIVNGSIASSSTIVSLGGVLEGVGTVGDLVAYGSVMPGNVSGALHVNGSASFISGSNYVISIDQNGASDLVINGVGTIDPGVSFDVNVLSGFIPFTHTPQAVMEASSIVGTFSSIATNSSWVTGALTYTANSVLLDLTLKKLASLGFQGNSQRVAVAIDTVVNSSNPALDGVMESLIVLSDQEIYSALNQMQPSLFKGLVISQESNATRVQDSLGIRLQNEMDIRGCKDFECKAKKNIFHFWLDSFGDNLHQKATTYEASPQFGYQNNTLGIVLGFDGNFARDFYAGALGGYTDSDIHFVGNHGKGTIHSGYGGFYLSYLHKRIYATGSMIGAWSNYTGDRNIRYPDVNEIARNRHGGRQLLSHVDTGLNFKCCGVTIRPFDSVHYVIQDEEGYTEFGGRAYNLQVNSSNASLLRNELGLQFVRCFSWYTSKWTVSPKISWVREIRTGCSEYTATFVDTEAPFTVTGYLPTRSFVSPGVVVSGRTCSDLFSFDLYYSGEYTYGYTNHNYGGQIRFGY